MEIAVISIFTIGYLLIAFEHSVRINKTATALVTGILCWAVVALVPEDFPAVSGVMPADQFLNVNLTHHLSDIAGILFFLVGAMTIVELVDAHDGFQLITSLVKTRDVRILLWILSWVAFILSAVLDNLTTSIVMVSLIRKIIPYRDTRMFFAGMIIIAANAGGAWSPIGDVTTTMLWIGGQITSLAIIKGVILPSIVCLLVPLVYLSFKLKGKLEGFESPDLNKLPEKGSKIMMFVGVGSLISVPVFKTLTHLPPYMGILLGLGVCWVISEIINPEADEAQRSKYSPAAALSRIDIPSVLFFFGILLAVGLLETIQTLNHFAAYLQAVIGDQRIIISLIGVMSALIDNVPLVAASMGMYTLDVYPTDHLIWHFLAYCAGTGGSLLIIGSAAGVAVMGMEGISFMWYVKKISVLAFAGFAAGAMVYLIG